MADRPVFVDNQHGNTLAQALNKYLGVIQETGENVIFPTPDIVCICTAYFNPTGFAQIANVLKHVPTVQILLGTDLGINFAIQRKRLDETFETFEHRRIQDCLRQMDAALCRERDSLPFTRSNAKALRTLTSALRENNIEVRRYEKAFLHAKAYIFSNVENTVNKVDGIFVGSSNLTGAGLSKNLELNLGHKDQIIVEQAKIWFDKLWEEAIPYDLAEVFDVEFEQYSAWVIFLRVLWRLYGSEVTSDEKEDQNLPLTSFQKHGVARALRLIQEMDGVIVADEVGLGKTFIAGEILQIYLNRRQRALLVCPASVRDSTWRWFLSKFQLYVECVSFQQLANDVQLRDAQRPNADQNHLKRDKNEYQLIIVDEAHNYRNPNTKTLAAVLRSLLFGQKRDLVLLTATPVNNSLWDLYHLISYFQRQDAQLADRGILSIRQRFEEAMKKDPASLNPDLLFPIIDATTVKRTRQFVKKHYSNDTIVGPDGHRTQIMFPQPKVISVRYNLEGVLPGFFDSLEKALDPDSGDAIAFARYAPQNFLLNKDDGEDYHRIGAMIGLLRSALLKRFESSAYAFSKTVRKIVQQHEIFLEALNLGYVVNTAFLSEISADDEAFLEELLEESENRSDATLYEIPKLRSAVERDRKILDELAKTSRTINSSRDPKLQVLFESLIEIAKQAEEEAINSLDEAQKRKVLIFSFYEDTVKWIRDFLINELSKSSQLNIYHDRIEVISGSEELSEESRKHIVEGFAPISMVGSQKIEDDLYDILISTDVLAEGVNLQQCRHIINYDMPWNPMRLVQRHGRIDRIGSPHNHVYLRTIFPADQLDRLLNLEQRILNKLAMAAASVGVMAPIEGAAYGTQVFTETREEIEKLVNEDSSLFERGATVNAAQTGEEYRQTLRKALALNHHQISNLPWKIGSGMRKGSRRGIFFCAVVGYESEYERTYLRFVLAGEDWAPISENNSIEREVGTCLRLIECESKNIGWFPEFIRDRVYDFWEIAKQDIEYHWMLETDPANLQPPVKRLNLQIAEYIRKNPPINVNENRKNRALDILESPWPNREKVMLRNWFQSAEYEGSKLSNYLIDKIIDTGLQPVIPPDPLPPISEEDIELYCWMAIESEN